MAEKELRRMSRSKLIEIIYELRKSEEALQAEIEALEKQLEEKQHKISKAGSLAELSAGLNGLFEAAQATADDYLAEIQTARKRAQSLKANAERLARQTLEERQRTLARTEADCRRIREAARAGRTYIPPAAEEALDE